MTTSTQKVSFQKVDNLQKIQESFSKRIDNACERLLDSFGKILYAAHVQVLFFISGVLFPGLSIFFSISQIRLMID